MDIDSIINKALEFANNKEYNKALVVYDEAIKLDNEKLYAHYGKANVYYNLKEYKKALICYDKVIELDNDYANAYYGKGISYYHLQEYKKALICYDKTIKLDSEYTHAYNGKGNLYNNIQEYEKAIECYQEAIDLDDNYTFAYNGKGNVYYNLKEYKKALECYEKAIYIDNKFLHAYNGKANVYHNLEQYNKALNWYNKVIKIDNTYALSYKNRGSTYYYLKEFVNAINDYKKAIELDPDLKDDLEYWIEKGEKALEEQKKNQQNEKRLEISKVIDEIKKLLEYKEPQVCHYTSAFVFKELCKGSKLRFSHVALVNDPTEGKSLYDFLGVESIERADQSGFIGSFVESHNNDSLPLWRAYGRDGAGVSICLDRKVLIEIINTEVSKEIEKSVNTDTAKISRKIYKIVYVHTYKNDEGEGVWDFLIDGEQDEELEKKLEKLKKLLKPLIDDKTVKNEEALEPVLEIQYLFKNAIYKGEREVRYYELLPNDFSQIKWDDSTELPTTYIEVENDIRNHIQNVTLGPKAKNASTWMALYKTMLAREGNKDVSVTQSKIPYR